MSDQAAKLRILLRETEQQKAPVRRSVDRARVVSIASGKGGVGKTTLAVNLALAAQKAGLSTVLFDADLALANTDILLGLVPQYNLLHVLRDEKRIDEIVCVGPEGLRLVVGGSGWSELANLSRYQLGKFIAGLAEFDNNSDVVIIDTGAGLSANVLNFLYASHEIIVVTTPEPTAITDAYAVIKAVSTQGVAKIHVVVNRVRNQGAATAVFDKLAATAKRFLQVELDLLGWLPEDNLVTKTIIQQEAIFLEYPNSKVAQAIRQIESTLFQDLSEVTGQKEGGLRAFFTRLTGLLKGGAPR